MHRKNWFVIQFSLRRCELCCILKLMKWSKKNCSWNVSAYHETFRKFFKWSIDNFLSHQIISQGVVVRHSYQKYFFLVLIGENPIRRLFVQLLRIKVDEYVSFVHFFSKNFISNDSHRHERPSELTHSL